MLAASVQRIRKSRLLTGLGLLSLADYAGWAVVVLLEKIAWQEAMLLFVFSAATWYFAVGWVPFWNEVVKERGNPTSRAVAEFMDNFALLALILVQVVYTAILVVIFVER